MIVKFIVDEDFVNYRKPSMFIGFPSCSFKCEKDSGVRCCQNSELSTALDINITSESIIQRYLKNPITSAIVCGGLEPLDNFDDLSHLLYSFRDKTNDDVVIYTGYTKQECEENGWLEKLSNFRNVIVKFGRYIPNSTSHYDEILGVVLKSEGQYAEKIS